MKKKRSISLKTRDSLVGTLFMSPWLIGLLVFTLIPFIYSVWLSLCSVEFGPDGMQTAFVGGRWYKEIFSADAYFLQALKDTLQFIVLFMPMILVVAIICALLLNKALHGRTFFRILFFFPVVVISGPVMEKLISNQATAIISADTYYVYQVIENLPAILSTPLMYIFDNIVLILWYAGVQMLIVLAGLQKIGDSLYEAASIDGASAWQSFWKITLPYLRPMILIAAVYTVVDLAAMTSTPMYTLIQNNVTNVERPYSYSAALSWLYALVVLVILGIVYRILREKGEKQP
ncbi:ABC transporter permease subunit [Clostridia bacterium]|jgi:inner membrane protein